METTKKWGGFTPPKKNTVTTPNQFFSAGFMLSANALKVLGDIISRSYRWNNAGGAPIGSCIKLSFKKFSVTAGVSEKRVGSAIKELIEHKFLTQSVISEQRKGQRPSDSAGCYELRFSDEQYTDCPEKFDGFFRGRGHFSEIPREFFEVVLARQNTNVARVVGTLLRQTVGWCDASGDRRQDVKMSVTQLSRMCGMSRNSVQTAIQVALEAGYFNAILGTFVPANGRENLSTSTLYCVKWSDTPPEIGTEKQQPPPKLVRSSAAATPPEIGTEKQQPPRNWYGATLLQPPPKLVRNPPRNWYGKLKEAPPKLVRVIKENYKKTTTKQVLLLFLL